MLGTLVNFAAIIAGGFAGLLVKGRLKEKHKDIVMQGIGLAVLLIGISGAADKLISGEADSLLMIISLAIGGLIGELLNIDGKFNKLAEFAQSKLAKGDNTFAQGFVTASVLYCVGTMAVVGSIESGVMGKHDILFAKALIDGITAIVFSASLGTGVILSALPVLVYQGALTLTAQLFEPYITDAMLGGISVVGGMLVFAIGTNMLNMTKIKLANFLPAVFVPVIYYLLSGVF